MATPVNAGELHAGWSRAAQAALSAAGRGIRTFSVSPWAQQRDE